MEPSLKAQQAFAKALECLEDARWALQGSRAASAVNRAYYAMFHAAEAALLAQLGLEFSSHGAVQAAFGKHFARSNRVPRRLHQLFVLAFEARQEADYELAAKVSLEEARERVSEAEEFVLGVQPLVESDGGT